MKNFISSSILPIGREGGGGELIYGNNKMMDGPFPDFNLSY